MKTVFKPAEGDDAGRDATAEIIAELHKTGGKDELRRYFSAADLQKRPSKGEAFVGNHLTLKDPRGNTLKKGKQPSLREALEETVSALQEFVDRPRPNGSVNAIKSVHAAGPNRLAKVAFPPQSSNAQWDDVRSDDGAGLAHDVQDGERQRAGVRPKASPFTDPQANSISNRRALPTQDSLEAIKEAQKSPRPLVPGALRR